MNAADRKRDDTERYGTRNGRAKLDDDKVREILELRSTGITNQALADRYGLNPRTIYGIVNRISWTHIEWS